MKGDDMPAKQDKTSTGPIRVLIVDDHPIVREGLSQKIGQQKDMVVCGEADNAADALALIESEEVDAAVVDLSLKDSSGLDLIRDIQVRRPGLPVLVLSMRNESIYAERALRAGARGYITKEEGTTRVIEGLREVLTGRIYLSENMVGEVLRKIVPGPQRGVETGVGRLTDRELEVLRMIGNGVTTAEIAQKLHLSVKTIETYRERIKEKLNLSRASELLKYAIQWAHSQ